jgi:hypothetical protein
MMRTPLCRSLLPTLVLLALILGGCASQATHLSGDLATADNSCQQHPNRTMTDRVQCYGAKERPVVAKDLPNALSSYDAFRSATLAAAKDFDGKVTFANDKALAVLNAAKNDDIKRLNATVAPFWPKDHKQAAALLDRVTRAQISACMKDGLYLSPSLVADYTCERNAGLPVVEKEIPAASEAYREYWDQMLEAAAIRDQSVLPVIQKAQADFGQAVAPARAAYQSDVLAALQADATASAQQQQEIANALGLALAGFAAFAGGYAAPAVPAPVFTSCTRVGNVVNCIGQ